MSPFFAELLKEMLHTELLETWDEKGLPLEDFSVAGPRKAARLRCFLFRDYI